MEFSGCDNISIRHNSFVGNGESGIKGNSNDDAIILNNTAAGNRNGIFFQSKCRNIMAYNNSIYNNSEYGFKVTYNDDFPMDARNNYWGSNSGPFQSETNKKGKGDNVTDMVEFSPWITQIDGSDSDGDNGGGGEGEWEEGPLVFGVLMVILGILVFMLLLLVLFLYEPSSGGKGPS